MHKQTDSLEEVFFHSFLKAQRGLWTILSNRVMISGKRCCCWVFKWIFLALWAPWATCHPIKLCWIEGRHLYSWCLRNSVAHNKTIFQFRLLWSKILFCIEWYRAVRLCSGSTMAFHVPTWKGWGRKLSSSYCSGYRTRADISDVGNDH